MLLTLSASAFLLQAQPAPASPPDVLAAVSTRDAKVVRRWILPGDPHGIAIGADGTIYVGLAQPQAVIAVDPKTGTVKKRLVLDSAEIASTKELVTLRVNRDGSRLYIANGSDESASILSLPDLAVVREITMEGETIRDALPDPKGRYLYLLGRHVHVFDAAGQKEIKRIEFNDPTAVAASADGALLAVLGPEDFGNTKATVAALFDTATFREVSRNPMQTTETIESAFFAPRDRALVAVSRDHLFEKPLSQTAKTMTSATNGQMRMSIDFGDLVNSDHICLPEGSGAQIATLGPGDLVLFAERRCAVSGAFSGSSRQITPVALYGVDAYGIAFDRDANTLVATDRKGYLTIYKVPRPAVVR